MSLAFHSHSPAWGLIHKGPGLHVSSHGTITELLDQVAYQFWQETEAAGKNSLAEFDNWVKEIRKVIIEEQG